MKLRIVSGYLVTARDDGSIPLNARTLANISFAGCGEGAEKALEAILDRLEPIPNAEIEGLPKDHD